METANRVPRAAEVGPLPMRFFLRPCKMGTYALAIPRPDASRGHGWRRCSSGLKGSHHDEVPTMSFRCLAVLAVLAPIVGCAESREAAMSKDATASSPARPSDALSGMALAATKGEAPAGPDGADPAKAVARKIV